MDLSLSIGILRSTLRTGFHLDPATNHLYVIHNHGLSELRWNVAVVWKRCALYKTWNADSNGSRSSRREMHIGRFHMYTIWGNNAYGFSLVAPGTTDHSHITEWCSSNDWRLSTFNFLVVIQSRHTTPYDTMGVLVLVWVIHLHVTVRFEHPHLRLDSSAYLN